MNVLLEAIKHVTNVYTLIAFAILALVVSVIYYFRYLNRMQKGILDKADPGRQNEVARMILNGLGVPVPEVSKPNAYEIARRILEGKDTRYKWTIVAVLICFLGLLVSTVIIIALQQPGASPPSEPSSPAAITSVIPKPQPDLSRPAAPTLDTSVSTQEIPVDATEIDAFHGGASGYTLSEPGNLLLTEHVSAVQPVISRQEFDEGPMQGILATAVLQKKKGFENVIIHSYRVEVARFEEMPPFQLSAAMGGVAEAG